MAMADFTEQELLDDLLTCEKNLLTLYNTAVIESSSNELKGVFQQNMGQCVQDQFAVWQQMNQKGYYPTKPVDQNELNTTKQKFMNMKPTVDQM